MQLRKIAGEQEEAMVEPSLGETASGQFYYGKKSLFKRISVTVTRLML